jgi:DUF4097 and DUF4098 domain-containing protein YvlB
MKNNTHWLISFIVNVKEKKMRKDNFQKMFLVFLSCFVVAAMGCNTNGCEAKEKYERIVTLKNALPADGSFEAQTHNGHINVTGADVAECNLIATITAHADTVENAQKLAEAVEVKLISSGNKLTAKIEKPESAPHEYVCVDLDVTVPKQTALQLGANVGEIKITDIAQPIKVGTNVGAISCKEITGDIDVKTNVGQVIVLYSKTAPSACNANVKIDVGEIDFTAPPGLSAQVNLSANLGSIQTALPLTVKGKINQDSSGSIGKGEGKITLKTNVGSIKIR